MYSTAKPRRRRSSLMKRAHASYASPGGFTVGMRTRSTASCTSSPAARSTSAQTRSARAPVTMRYCSAMKRAALLLACAAASALGPAAQPSSRAAFGLTAVDGIKVGHHTLAERPTGCTVVLVDGDAVGGVSQRGGAPGTRETDLLNPLNMVDKVNAIVLAGGSAFVLEAATGTVRSLEEPNMGWPAGVSKVPIVPAAILFDLGVGGSPRGRPPPHRGQKKPARGTGGPAQEGTIGAGARATVGKLVGAGRSAK